jgi:hypothetical protein
MDQELLNSLLIDLLFSGKMLVDGKKTVATDFNGQGCFIYGMHGLTIPRKLQNAR